jgi:hypothetical protein
MTPGISEFFAEFERHNSAQDFDQLVKQYAEVFLSADPSGTRPVRRQDLAAALPKRKQLVQSAGCKSTRLISLDETPLDALHTLVRTSWRWQFATKEITLASTFILRNREHEWEIVFYLAHDDLIAALRQNGLLAAGA